MDPIPSRNRKLWTAECPTPQRVRWHSLPRNFPERPRLRHRCGLGQAALRPDRTAECPTPQRVARAGRQITFQRAWARATCFGLRQAALPPNRGLRRNRHRLRMSPRQQVPGLLERLQRRRIGSDGL